MELLVEGNAILKFTKKTKVFGLNALEIPGCVTQGENEEELCVNMQEAINLYLEEPESSQNHLSKLALRCENSF